MSEKIDRTELKEKIVEAIKTCYDPEIPVDIYELGLIYDIYIDDTMTAHIKMSLTSPSCPVAGTLPGEVEGIESDCLGIVVSAGNNHHGSILAHLG